MDLGRRFFRIGMAWVSEMLHMNWLRSARTQALFSYSACVVACMGLFMAFMPTPWFSQIAASRGGLLTLRVLGGTLGVLGAPASLVILFGMMTFCAREDHSPTSTKILWFVFFFFTAPFGTLIYFFSVYRRQVQVDDYDPIGARSMETHS